MKKIVLFLFLSNIVLAQKYVVFENNKKNKALFDYNDPNSLVSMLVQNRDKIIYNNTRDEITTGVNEYSVHPVDEMPSFSLTGPAWSIEGDDDNMTKLFLLRESNNESFENWFERLTTIGTAPEYNPNYYGALKRINPNILRMQYDKSKEGFTLRLPDVISYYDLDNIDFIFSDLTTLYFAKKSPYENKHYICLTLKLSELNDLVRFDCLNQALSKSVYSKLREYQLRKKELDDDIFPVFNIQEYYSYSQGNLFNSFDVDAFSYYKKTSCIKRIYPGGPWQIEGDDEDATRSVLLRDSNNESFENWFERLTTIGTEPDFNPDYYASLLRQEKKVLKNQYELAKEGTILRFPDFEAIYWVDYNDPVVYLERSFRKDSIGKFTTHFSNLLFTERLNNKKGFEQKPQVLMSFGVEDFTFDYLTSSIPTEIVNLLKEELKSFNYTQDFSWKKALSKGKKITNEDLKKLIHCYDINENGIQY